MVEKYVGIPYTFNGRTMAGVDCYGLVWLVEKEIFNKELPVLAELDGDKDKAEVFSEARPLIVATEVQNPVDGDVVLLFTHDVPKHVGIYFDKGVLHATETRGVVWERMGSKYLQRFNKKEFYRV